MSIYELKMLFTGVGGILWSISCFYLGVTLRPVPEQPHHLAPAHGNPKSLNGRYIKLEGYLILFGQETRPLLYAKYM